MRFTRSGGLLGGRPLTVELDAAQLTRAEADAVAAIEAGGGFARFASLPRTAPLAADAYQYDLEVRRSGHAVALRFDELSVPPELSTLVGLLERR